MKYVVALPYMNRDYAEETIGSLCPELRRGLVTTNNSEINRGIMWAHNRAVRTMHADAEAQWLIVMSSAVTFGPRMGFDFLDALDEHTDHDVVEAAGVFGWHLIAFSRQIITEVGYWDETFTPYGFDDIDMMIRIQNACEMAGREPLWTKAVIEIADRGMGLSVKEEGVRADVEAQIDYFTAKWGRHPGHSDVKAWSTPFNSGKPQGYWPGHERAGLESANR